MVSFGTNDEVAIRDLGFIAKALDNYAALAMTATPGNTDGEPWMPVMVSYGALSDRTKDIKFGLLEEARVWLLAHLESKAKKPNPLPEGVTQVYKYGPTGKPL